jgi:hypothetical protein
VISNISISDAAVEVTNTHDIPERFKLVIKADGCQEGQIGVAFD